LRRGRGTGSGCGSLTDLTHANWPLKNVIGSDFNKGILTIYINSAPLKQDLGFSKQQIIDRVNEELGERVVKEVAIR